MKYALVTGANRGLGLGLCERLAKKGYTVYAGMRSTDKFKSDRKEIIPIELTVDNDESIERAFAYIAQEGATISVLVNNAGVNKRSVSVGGMRLVNELDHLNRKALVHMVNVNAVSPAIVTRSALPLLDTSGAFVINITSGRASFANDGPSGNYGYRMSKVALNMFTKASSFELPSYVRTFAVHPGLVHTDMNPDGDIEPAESADKILRIMDDWDASKNGAFLDNDGNFFEL